MLPQLTRGNKQLTDRSQINNKVPAQAVIKTIPEAAPEAKAVEAIVEATVVDTIKETNLEIGSFKTEAGPSQDPENQTLEVLPQNLATDVAKQTTTNRTVGSRTRTA